MKGKIILLPDEMIKQMLRIKEHSGQSQSAIIRLALADYLKKYEQENQLTN